MVTGGTVRAILFGCVALGAAVALCIASLLALRLMECTRQAGIKPRWRNVLHTGAVLYSEATGAQEFTSSDLIAENYVIARDRFGSVPALAFKIEDGSISVRAPHPTASEELLSSEFTPGGQPTFDPDELMREAFKDSVWLLHYQGFQVVRDHAYSVDGIVLDFNESPFRGFEVISVNCRRVHIKTPDQIESVTTYGQWWEVFLEP